MRRYVIQFDSAYAAARFGRDVAEDYGVDVEVDACRVRFEVPESTPPSHAEVGRRATAWGSWKASSR
jgi:hypothetical protein